jgi:hypothetical protein
MDYDKKVRPRLQDFWDYAQSFLPPRPASVLDDLHPSIAQNEGTLKETLIHFRRTLITRDELGPIGLGQYGDQAAVDIQLGFYASLGSFDEGLLLNEAVAQSAAVAERLHDISCSFLLDTAMKWATLFSARKYLHESTLNGLDLNEAPGLGSELAKATRTLLAYASKDDLHESREVLFWLFFTGSWRGQKLMAERAYTGGQYTAALLAFDSDPDATTRWFDERLAEQAATLGLQRWSDAEALLRRFIYSNCIRPCPSTWYEKVVNGPGRT